MSNSFEAEDEIVWRTSQYPYPGYVQKRKDAIDIKLELEIDDTALYDKLHAELNQPAPAQSPMAEAIGATAAKSGLFGCLVLLSGLFYVVEWFKRNLGGSH